jgi:hypothetical protein
MGEAVEELAADEILFDLKVWVLGRELNFHLQHIDQQISKPKHQTTEQPVSYKADTE